MKKEQRRKENGITLIALIVTIVVLMILAGISIGALSGNGSVIKQATEAQILTELSNVKEALEIYKIRNHSDGDMSDEELVEEGLLKEIFINDTYRTVAILTDLKKIEVSGKLGKSGAKLKDTEVETILDLYDVYGIDMENGSLYYIRNGIWSTDETKITYTVADTGEEKEGYRVETLNQTYIEERKFITTWNVTLGEEEGSSTYSTVVLSANNAETNATIKWGDGTSTLIQHRVNGITLTEEELREKLTHTYTLSENDDGIREISISGTIKWFDSETKEKMIGIKQWGNVKFWNARFEDYINLSGTIPEPNVDDYLVNCATFTIQNSPNLTGEIPALFKNAPNLTTVRFYLCSGLESFAYDFRLPENVKEINNIFSGCTSLGNLPEGFTIPSGVTNMYDSFANCKNMTKLPDSFRLPEGVNDIRGVFAMSGITTLPEGFYIPSSVTNMYYIFSGCSNLISLPNSFIIPKGVTNISRTFYGCSSLSSLPENFTIPNSVQNMSCTFEGCQSLASLPMNLTIPSSVTDMYKCFYGCNNLSSLPENFTIPSSVANAAGLFNGCGSLKKLPDIFTIPEGVTTIEYAFSNCTSLESLPENFRISNSVTSLNHTFSNCPGLKSLPAELTIPDSVTNMDSTFRGCSSLETLPEKLILPSGVTNVKDLFYNCSSLVSLPEGFKIPEGVTSTNGFFGACVSLKSLPEGFTIPNGVTTINLMFYSCHNLESLPEGFTIPESVTEAGNNGQYSVFFKCWNLKGTITIRANMTNFVGFFGRMGSGSEERTLTVNYSSNCQNIDEVIATGDATLIKKGNLVD